MVWIWGWLEVNLLNVRVKWDVEIWFIVIDGGNFYGLFL